MRLYPAAGQTVVSVDGQNYIAGRDGTVDVPARYALSMLANGCIAAPDDLLTGASGDFAAIAAGAAPGLCIFHVGLNQPLWRNATNDGWVDATGRGVSP